MPVTDVEQTGRAPDQAHQAAMESAAEPPFHEELEQVWGARWGASDEVGVLVGHFLDYYVEHPVDFTRWAPGAQEVLEVFAEEMPEVALGMCTNKPKVATEAVAPRRPAVCQPG